MGANVLFVMWAGGGNVNPFLGLAESLQAAGHAVSAVATASLQGRLTDAGVAFAGAAEGWLPSADDVLGAVEQDPPDIIVVDYMLTAALCGAERTGVPTVALVHTLYSALLVDGAPNPMGMGGSVSDINQVRAGLGLEPIEGFGDLLLACDRVLVTAPAELDEPGRLHGNVSYVGAVFEGPGPDATWQPPAGDGPLIVVSVGTAGDPAVEVPLLQTILEALVSLPLRGFVTVSDYVDRAQLVAPANVTISSYVRHAAVLPHADLLVTHGGLGSVTAALAHGVPMVCLPLDREQPDNARAVERLGAGLVADPDTPPEVLRRLIVSSLDLPARVRFEPEPHVAVHMLESLVATHP